MLLAPGLIWLLLAIASAFGQPIQPGVGPSSDGLIGVIFSVGMLLAGILVHRKAIVVERSGQRTYWSAVARMTPTLLAPLALLLMLDAAAGGYLAANGRTPLPLFPPHSQITFRLNSFEYTAQTNALGMRDREINVQRTGGFRAIALGDSFTFGWGVAVEDSWPKALERHLVQSGWQAEVFNLGCPGTSVDAYATLAERAVPVLKPDLILVGVLPGSNLKKLEVGSSERHLYGAHGTHLQQLLGLMFKPKPVSAEELQAHFQQSAVFIEQSFTSEQKKRFESLDDEVKTLFRDGKINPPLVRDGVCMPDGLEEMFDVEQPATRRAIEAMAYHLRRIKEVAHREGAQVMVASLPWWTVDPVILGQMRRLGHQFDDSIAEGNGPDDAVRAAANAAGVECLSFTDLFRKQCRVQKIYYDFDCHFTPAGNDLYAEQVAGVLTTRDDFKAKATSAKAN